MISLNLSKLFSNKVLFKREFGTNIESFNCILDFVNFRLKPKQGRKPTISNEVRLLCFFSYLKRYDAMESLGLRFGISTTTVWRIIHEFKSILMGCDILSLNGIGDAKVIMIDGTYTRVEKPKFDAVGFYGRKKCYALKSQVVIDGYSKKVLAIDTCEGNIHDFQLFKYSDLCIPNDCGVIVDGCYVGIRKYYWKSVYPLKKPAKGSLSEGDKLFSSEVSKIGVLNEHVIGKMKFFKLFAGKFRHCKDLMFSFWCFACIVAGVYNLNLSLD